MSCIAVAGKAEDLKAHSHEPHLNFTFFNECETKGQTGASSTTYRLSKAKLDLDEHKHESGTKFIMTRKMQRI